ncbi:MAG: 50S ribosomal protein L17 [Bacteriovoracaceae bacterium]|jgi:large subunit ribosomal protein L17|nr:50S ribosomal protein L17 [Bacteriovoracaceae bacterium]
MRHLKQKYKLGVNPAHRASLVRNLAIEVIEHGKIKTTHARCMAIKGFVEKLVTLAKEDTVANRRLAFSKLNNDNAVKVLFTEVAPKYKTRNGGYTRVIKTADGRVGDNAKMSYIAFV